MDNKKLSEKFRFLKPGWWILHFLGIAIVYALGHILWWSHFEIFYEIQTRLVDSSCYRHSIDLLSRAHCNFCLLGEHEKTQSVSGAISFCISRVVASLQNPQLHGCWQTASRHLFIQWNPITRPIIFISWCLCGNHAFHVKKHRSLRLSS